MRLRLDFETRSELSLPLVGVYKYAPRCAVMLNSWAIDDGPVTVDETVTPTFMDAFCEADEIWAHNAEFDRTVLHHHMARASGRALDKVDIRFERWHCTMAQARRHGLPGGLDKLCDIFKVPSDLAKMKDSRALLMFFCKPDKQTGRFNEPKDNLVKWRQFKSYGGLDVSAMREIHRRMPKWNDAYERPIWLADQRVNARGFAVDTDLASKMVAALKLVSDDVDSQVQDATADDVQSARQVEAMLKFILAAYGVDLPDMAAATLERRIADPDLPEPVRELLALRQQSSKTSTSKYATLLRCTSDDGRLRGTLTYAGAMRTLRWAGNRFQPHNLPRPVVGRLRSSALKAEIRNGIAAVKAGVYDLVGTYPLPEVAASAIRGCVVAPQGKTLAVADYANVEGRGLAWLAGEEWKLQAFRDYDADTGPDLYKVSYSRAFGTPVDEVDDGAERQLGKVMELMLGFGGGVNAFITGCATYKIAIETVVDTAWPSIPDDVKEETAGMWRWAVEQGRTLGLSELVFRTCDGLKRLWRRRHPATVKFWDDLEFAFGMTCTSGRPHSAGSLRIDKEGAWLRIWLPSGRCLNYPSAKVEGGKLTYMGQNAYTRTWSRIDTYGGKLAENVTQALCRDLLAEALVEAEQCGLSVVLHTHDELIDEGTAASWEDVAACMKRSTWAAGLPLAVAGFDTDRYHKD